MVYGYGILIGRTPETMVGKIWVVISSGVVIFFTLCITIISISTWQHFLFNFGILIIFTIVGKLLQDKGIIENVTDKMSYIGYYNNDSSSSSGSSSSSSSSSSSGGGGSSSGGGSSRKF